MIYSQDSSINLWCIVAVRFIYGKILFVLVLLLLSFVAKTKAQKLARIVINN